MDEVLNFVCPSKDCNQRVFSDERQLVSHKRKHDMVLSLNKSNQYTTDETPTPTRFIRNCEAIGLFQDLQNVNPFDETFKKAVEAVKKGELIRTPSISTLGKPAGEDLHTPHIDLTDDTQSSNNGNEDEEVETVIRSEADTSLKSTSVISQAFPLPMSEDSRDGSKSGPQDLRLLVKMGNGTLLEIPSGVAGNLGIIDDQNKIYSQTIIIPNPTFQNVNLEKAKVEPIKQTTSSASAAVKQKLKAALLRTGKVTEVIRPPPQPSLLSANHTLPTPEGRREKNVTSSTSGDEDYERKRRTLERNRVAAMRCREKRKKWVADLRDKYDKMCVTNEALVREVTSLREEVARLKACLLTCSQHHVQDLTTTTIQIVPTIPHSKPLPSKLSEEKTEPLEGIGVRATSGSSRCGREGLRLDIEGATRVTVMDLDSPVVRRDEILSSVAAPSTPNERLMPPFSELDRVSDSDISDEKMLTTVIQINPKALSKLPSAFS